MMGFSQMLGRAGARIAENVRENRTVEDDTPTHPEISWPNRAALDVSVRVPPLDMAYRPEAGCFQTLSFLAAVADREGAGRLLITGAPGTGKTMAIQQFAARRRRRCFVFNCAVIKSPDDWFGTRELIEGETRFHLSALAYTLLVPYAVLVLDEINRCRADLLAPLFDILDERRSFHLRALQTTLPLAHGILLVATANLGESASGTFELPDALLDRFSLRYEMPTFARHEMISIIEDRSRCSHHQAGLLWRIGDAINQACARPYIGLRQMIDAARLLAAGMSLKQTVTLSMLNHLSEDGDVQSDRYKGTFAAQGIAGQEWK
jgi:hypothetical protein